MPSPRIFTLIPLQALLFCLPAFAQAPALVLNVPDAEQISFSPLAQAAMGRDMERVRSLLVAEEPLDVNGFGADGASALHWAVRYGDMDAVDWLVTAGADINLPSDLGFTPLHLAIENGHTRLVEWLLENGANPETPDPAGEPPLFLATAMGDMASIDLLLGHGADVDREDRRYGQSALMIGIRTGNSEVVTRLLAAGADVNKQTDRYDLLPGRDGNFVPPSEIPGALTQGRGIIRGGWPERGKRQPLAGAKTPLLYATRLGDLAITRQLVNAGADIEQVDANGITPLINAIINKSIVTLRPDIGEHLKVASYLVDQGADVNTRDWYGQSPLWAAVDIRNLLYKNVSTTENNVDRDEAFALIERILDAGADPNVRTREYPPSRHYILTIGSVEWVDFTGQTPFFRAALAGDVNVMRLLLERGADPNISTYSNTTPLMAAAGVGWAEGQTFHEGEAQLLEAIRLAHSLGNDINAVNSMGLQAIHGGANRGSNDIIRYLAANGAELDRPDDVGRTPVNWAEGEYLPSRPKVYKTETITLLEQLMGERD